MDLFVELFDLGLYLCLGLIVVKVYVKEVCDSVIVLCVVVEVVLVFMMCVELFDCVCCVFVVGV